VEADGDGDKSRFVMQESLALAEADTNHQVVHFTQNTEINISLRSCHTCKRSTSKLMNTLSIKPLLAASVI
jgi:hypothetical protein